MLYWNMENGPKIWGWEHIWEHAFPQNEEIQMRSIPFWTVTYPKGQGLGQFFFINLRNIL